MSRILTDQMGRTVTTPEHPRRIVSLVPSQTELLCDLGLEEEVVGITKFCIHPRRWQETKSRVGGTKKLNHEAIRSLSPDLVIGNKEENSRADLEKLMTEYSVWMSDVRCLEDALQMMASVGTLTTKEEQAQQLCRRVEDGFRALETRVSASPKRTLYLIWRRPWMGAGASTFIDDMLRRCGLQNALERQSRYPELSFADMEALQPDLVLLSSEPYPFKPNHADEIREALPHVEVVFADGEMFSWYGSRLQHAPAYFEKLLEQIHTGC